MASPVGHALVGVATAAVVARVSGVPMTTPVFAGAVIASGFPDLDLLGAAFGKSGPRYHRNASHSLLLLVLGSVVLVWALPRVTGIGTGVCLTWVAALLSHPLLDVITTGPELGSRGYGIGVYWPVSQRRVFVRHPLVATPELDRCRSVGDLRRALWPEFKVLAPPVVVVLLAVLLI